MLRDEERALKTFEKVSKRREKAFGFGNLKTMICSKIKAELLIQSEKEDEAYMLLTSLHDYCKTCFPQEESLLGGLKMEILRILGKLSYSLR